VASPGEDLQLATRITFDETFCGTRRRVQVMRQDQCPACHGSGDAATTPVACQRCDGSGQVRTRRGHMVFRRPCEDCGGLGSIRRQACARCSGEGRLVQSEWLDVTIPAGVVDGSELRMPGCGNVGRRGGASGDLVLRVTTEPHALYTREEADLHCAVPITMTEAALGAHIEVPTPDGPMTIEIPAGTQTGQRFRLRGRGMPRVEGKGRGSLFIEARVWVAAADPCGESACADPGPGRGRGDRRVARRRATGRAGGEPCHGHEGRRLARLRRTAADATT